MRDAGHEQVDALRTRGTHQPIPRVKVMYKRSHWVSTVVVGAVFLALLASAAFAKDPVSVLVIIGVTGLITGLYIAVTARVSWAHIPGGRRSGAILTVVSMAVMLFVGILPQEPVDLSNLAKPGQVAQPDVVVAPAPAFEVPAQPDVVVAPAPAFEVPAQPEPAPPAPAPEPIPAPAQEQYVFYANCTAVKAAGAAPIQIGDPGWDQGFDGDGDGIGCELEE